MSKDKLSDYDGTTAGNNTDIGGISIAEGMLPSAVNNSMRELTRQLGAFANGTEAVAQISFGDNAKAVFGDAVGGDLQIWHSGANSFISDAGTGNLYLGTDGTGINLTKGAGGESMATFVVDGAVTLYYDNASKLATTSTGIDVTGTVTADAATLSGTSPVLSYSDTDNSITAQIGSGTSDFNIATTSAHNLDIRTNNTRRMVVESDGDVSLYADDGTTQGLFWDASTQRLGLGSTSPSFALEVNAANGGGLSVVGASDTNSGWRLKPLGNDLYISQNGISDNVVFKDGGNVGIGTSSVATNFRQEIVGLAGSNTSSATSGTTQNASAVMRIRPGGGFTATLDIGQGGGTGSWLQSTDTTNLATTYPLLLNPAGGNVGIGTSSPAQKLDISGGSIALDDTQELRFGTSAVASVTGVDGASGYLSFATNGVGNRMRIDGGGNVVMGGGSLAAPRTADLQIHTDFAGGAASFGDESSVVISTNTTSPGSQGYIGSLWFGSQDVSSATQYGWKLAGMAGYMAGDTGTGGGSADLLFYTASASQTGTERMRIDSSGNVMIATTNTAPGDANTTTGFAVQSSGKTLCSRAAGAVLNVQRGNDGTLVAFVGGGTEEGNISVSGTTVSYNGGHLSRWSQATDGNRIDGLVKGTVMTNLDQMAEWTKDGVTEDNEQLNCMAVSSVEGDANVAGVFVNWDDDDEDYTADMNIAMTGDMVIRIAQGTTVARGDLLMSAGDGTAKPQGDDIVRSKTIAKVTSTTVSHTYDDGSYLVPCVLMAC